MKTTKMASPNTPKNPVPLDFTKVCRLCNDNLSSFIDLFKQKSMREGILEFLRSIRLQVEEGDGFPTRICMPCYRKIIKFQEFLKLCFSSAEQHTVNARFKRRIRSPDSPAKPAKRCKYEYIS